MYTDHIVSESEHINWIKRLSEHDTTLVFAILGASDAPLGAVSANALDRLHHKSDWAYYLTENARGGIGAAVEASFIDFAFDSLGIEKLNCEVIEGNDSVIKLHKHFLFSDEGFRRSNVIKNDARMGVHLLGLTKAEWTNGRSAIYSKYQSVLNRFDIVIERPLLPTQGNAAD
jgi:UDP-4-amino-4,6-dideoxy-N-acetyl-beta-L-altrosamine N-acetyltransferase